MKTGMTGTLGRAARSFREQHQDLAAVERLLAGGERVAAFLAATAPHRNDADDVEREPAAQLTREEIIHGRHRGRLARPAPGSARRECAGVTPRRRWSRTREA